MTAGKPKEPARNVDGEIVFFYCTPFFLRFFHIFFENLLSPTNDALFAEAGQ